jgi:NAD(P)-dependent dehydrogenase (short-subunit alcohol dehydrogenase family)
MTTVAVVSGASSGFGAMTVRELALAGHRVYAGMRDVAGRNAAAAGSARDFAAEQGVDLRPLELDVSDQRSVDAAVEQVVHESGQVDVLVHNAGHMVLGPTEAFTVEQVAEVYDVNVLSTQRLNAAVLPHMRARRSGLLVWVGSSSARGGTPPYLGPYFAAKAAEDALAVGYAVELAGFGIDSVIVVPGSFTVGTNHFAHAGHAGRRGVVDEYDAQYPAFMDEVAERLAALAPEDQDPHEVAVRIREVVDLPVGARPSRIYVDPVDDGAEEVFRVGERVRQEFYDRLGLSHLLPVRVTPTTAVPTPPGPTDQETR